MQMKSGQQGNTHTTSKGTQPEERAERQKLEATSRKVLKDNRALERDLREAEKRERDAQVTSAPHHAVDCTLGFNRNPITGTAKGPLCSCQSIGMAWCCF
jgi:hypothetical protein